MNKISVAEYADSLKISVQSVYQRIKRGSLKSVEENGIKYVLIDNEEIKRDLKPKVESEFKDLLKIIKSQQKEIKRLNKALEKAKNEEVQTLKAFIGEMKQLTAPQKDNDDIIDLEEVQAKKKKKKKKKKF